MSNLPHKLESVFLWAINTGSLYPEHKRLTGESLIKWREHVKSVILPNYRCETKDRESTFSREERGLIAAELAAYYVDHDRENVRREAMTRDAIKTLPVAPVITGVEMLHTIESARKPVPAAELKARGVESISLAQRLPAACPAAESVPVYVSKPEALDIPAAAWDEPGPVVYVKPETVFSPEPVKAAGLALPFHRHESPDAFPETVMDSHDPLLTALDEAAETAINAARTAVYAAGLVRIQRVLEAYKVTYPELEFCFIDAMGAPGVHVRETGSSESWKSVTWFRYWPVSPNDAESINDGPSLQLVQELESLAEGLGIDWSHVERSPGFFRDNVPSVDRLDPEE